MSDNIISSENVSNAPIVSVSSVTSTDLSFGGEIHHLGVIIPPAFTFSGSVILFPGFTEILVGFPRVELVHIEVSIVAHADGCSVGACLTGEGSGVSAANYIGQKAHFSFTANELTCGKEMTGVFKPGDAIASQLRPVSSTAIPPHLFLMRNAHADADVAVHFYYRTSGPRNTVVVAAPA